MSTDASAPVFVEYAIQRGVIRGHAARVAATWLLNAILVGAIATGGLYGGKVRLWWLPLAAVPVIALTAYLVVAGRHRGDGLRLDPQQLTFRQGAKTTALPWTSLDQVTVATRRGEPRLIGQLHAGNTAPALGNWSSGKTTADGTVLFRLGLLAAPPEQVTVTLAQLAGPRWSVPAA